MFVCLYEIYETSAVMRIFLVLLRFYNDISTQYFKFDHDPFLPHVFFLFIICLVES